jgi:hypothetical protein
MTKTGLSPNADWRIPPLPGVVFTVVLLVLAGWHLRKSNQVDTPLIVLFVLASLPWFSAVFESIEMPGGWKIKYRALEQKVDETRQAVERLYALSMSPATVGHLRDLTERRRHGHVYVPPEPTSGMAGELNYLKVLGYIEFTGGSRPDGVQVWGVGNLPVGNQSWEELYKYVAATATGREFLKLHDIFAPGSKA